MWWEEGGWPYYSQQIKKKVAMWSQKVTPCKLKYIEWLIFSISFLTSSRSKCSEHSHCKYCFPERSDKIIWKYCSFKLFVEYNTIQEA